MSPAEANPPATDETIDIARATASAGLKVVPIKPGKQHPPMAAWQHAATVDPDTINNWWGGLYRTAGIGIALGPQPDGRNVFAIDVDQHDPAKDGFEELAELEAKHGALPETVRSITGGGGQHQLFIAPRGAIVRNQQANGNRIAPGIDVRGDGGQIVVAPTVHPGSGRQYEWEDGHAPWEHDIAPAPAWLLELVTERPPAPAPAPSPFTGPGLANPDTGDSIAERMTETWDWRTELTARGWTEGNRPDPNGDTYWTRPGKNPRDGHSAILHAGRGPFVIFTTEIPMAWLSAGNSTRDGSGWSFSPFGFYAAAEHNGDRSEAARALRTALNDTISAAAAHTLPGAPGEPPAEGEPEVSYDDALMAMLVQWPDFWNADHGDAEWLAEPVLAAYRSTALFAPGGTGKSLLSLNIAAAIATGQPIFGMAQPAVNVLYLDYEMTPDDLAERLESMGYGEKDDMSRLHYALLPSLPGLDEPEGGRAVLRLAQLCDAQLVVIDTFSRAVVGDENDADTVRSWYRNTGLHLKHDGRAFLRVDHAGKDVAKGQRGTSAKNDDVDVVWQMTAKDNGAYTLTAKKRRMGWIPEKVELQRHDSGALRFDLADAHSWPAGTAEMANVLDDLGVDVEAPYRVASTALREAGQTSGDKILRAAVKYRRTRTSLSHLNGDLSLAADTEHAYENRTYVRGTTGVPQASDEHLETVRAASEPETDKTPGQRAARRSLPHVPQAPGVSVPQCGERSEPHAGASGFEGTETDNYDPLGLFPA